MRMIMNWDSAKELLRKPFGFLSLKAKATTPALKPEPKQPTPRKSPKRWRYNELYATAFTKSEARAQFKRILQLKRLPPGAHVALVH